jgi:hypothetical protein
MKYLITLLVYVLFLVGCGKQAEEHANHTVNHLSGDIQEKTASITELPTFLNGLNENISIVYALAGQNAELLDWIPCFCGCGESAGHKSNKNCFIKEINEDGSVVWDDHGTRCGVCMEIAVESAKMKQSGNSDKEIRQYIDNTYKEGYATPTDTPMPA